MVRKKIVSILCCIIFVMTIVPYCRASASAAPIIAEVPVSVNFDNITGIDLNIRLNPLFVEKAEPMRFANSIAGSTNAYRQDGDRLKIGIASAAPLSNTGVLFYLRLTLKQDCPADTELCKILQIKLNEQITWQADNCILLSGVKNEGAYNHNISVRVNEGTVLLDGETYECGSEISEEGQHTFIATDLRGNQRTICFEIDKTAPVIEIQPYSVEPTKNPVTVHAAVTGGELEEASHLFLENGSFVFRANDKAGNSASKTVTISHIYQSFTLELLNIPECLETWEKMPLDISKWKLKILYDTGAEKVISVASHMLQADVSSVGTKEGTVTYDGVSASFSYEVKPALLESITILSQPVKTSYIQGEELDLSGLKLRASYNNGDFSEVTSGWTVTGFHSNQIGKQKLTISYGGYQTTLDVTVNSRMPSSITSDRYLVKDGRISKIPVGTTVKTLLAGIHEGQYCRVYKGSKELSASAVVGTGMTVKLMDGSKVIAQVTIVVTGDVNGDGTISITDMIAIKAHILKKNLVKDVFAVAADTNGDGGISITDFIQTKAHILGKAPIKAR